MAGMAIYLTENGYALCPLHMAAWRASGWNGGAEPMSAERAAYEVTGDASEPMTCAVVQPGYGCPPNGTMGHCFAESATSGPRLVLVNSLQPTAGGR